mmetsp:Transcript_20599/g.29377  ORF Transcript_20599/g.29377 Transcript_20599/m.29377 type:complete len:144 (+) Transcript_20599:41-472(+)
MPRRCNRWFRRKPLLLDEDILLTSAIVLELQQEAITAAHGRLRWLLLAEDKHRRDRRIPRRALQDPNESVSEKLFRSGEDSSLITLTGLDHRCFAYLQDRCATLYDRFWPYTEDGRLRLLPLDPHDHMEALKHLLLLGVSVCY